MLIDKATMTGANRLCLYCRRYPATRLAVPYSGERYFCAAACAVRWAVRELDREPRGDRETVLNGQEVIAGRVDLS